MKSSIALASCITLLVSLVQTAAQAQNQAETGKIGVLPELTEDLGGKAGGIADLESKVEALESDRRSQAVVSHQRSRFAGGQPGIAIAAVMSGDRRFCLESSREQFLGRLTSFEALRAAPTLEPAPRQFQTVIKNTLSDTATYSPWLGVALLLFWNRGLRREVRRRQKTANRLQVLADNTPGIMYQYLLRQDGSEALLYVSSRCYEVWGVEAEAAVEDINRLWSLVHPDDLPEMRAAIFRSARSLHPWNQGNCSTRLTQDTT